MTEPRHPPQREMWYPGCMVDLAIILAVTALIGWLVDG